MNCLKHLSLDISIPQIESKKTRQYNSNNHSNKILPMPSSQQMSALYDLYNATNGSSWTWHSSDRFGIPWDFVNQSNPCSDRWQGITCSCNSEPPIIFYHYSKYYYYDDYVTNSTSTCNIVHISTSSIITWWVDCRHRWWICII